jgi:hypothetical protein
MSLQYFRYIAVSALATLALLAVANIAPAQVPSAARPPGQAEPTPPGQNQPTPPSGPATPIAAPTLAPTPEPQGSGSPTPAVQSGQPTSAAPVVRGSATASPGSGTTAPGSAAPGAGAANTAATPRPAVIRFSGQLLDLRNGYVFFTTSDAFKADPALRLVDLDTGGPTKLVPGPRIYARATLDPSTGSIVELALTKHRLATDAAYQQAYAKAHTFVVAGSPTVVAPELLHGVRLTGRPVAVTFFVQVPPTTPINDDVFITTDASGWVPNAMKMDRIDALHYRLTRTYASGTKFAYRYTRGSWTSVEIGEDGLQGDAHEFFVPEVDAKRLTDVVYRWSDQNPTAPQAGPDAIPTPFNPNPFGGFPSTVRQGVPPPSPTPRP